MDTEPAPQTSQQLLQENLRLKRAVEELSTLNAIGSAIGSTMNLDEVVELIAQESVKNLNAEQAAVMLLKQEEEVDPFRTMARQNFSGSELIPFRFGQQLTGWMLKNKRPLLINSLRDDERFRAIATDDFPFHSLISVPLRAKGQMVGLLNVFNKRPPDEFTSDDQRLLSIIASQSSQIVENARLYEELQRRKTELEDSEHKYRALIQEAAEAILLASVSDQRILEVNEQAERATGIPRERLLGRSLAQVLPASDLGSSEAFASMGEHDTLRMSFRTEADDGSDRFFDLSAKLVTFGGDKVIQVICLDVTEREKLAAHLRNHAVELERDVRAATRDLRDSQGKLVQQEKMAALGRLVAGIAHEMNTPIGTINSNADTLARSLEMIRKIATDPETPESVRENRKLKQVLGVLDDISSINKLACERIVGIVGSLRNFARLDQADLQIANLHDGLDSTLTLVHHELKNRVQVIKEYGDIAPVRCHPNQINQVFMNLLVNASQAISGAGEIRIVTSQVDNMVHVAISDTGGGIPKENLERIFDPGFTTKGVGVGTGLGLAITFKIVHDHNGSIDASSVIGEGSTFTVKLPIDSTESGEKG